MFRVLNNDNTSNTVTIQGAFSKNSNVDVCKLRFQNFDADTNATYVMSEIVMRDQWGSANSNGAGNFIIRTNLDGSSNLIERLRIQYDGKIGIGCTPMYVLDIEGSINSRGGYCNLLIDSYSNNDIHKAPTLNALSYVHTKSEWNSNNLVSFSNIVFPKTWDHSNEKLYIVSSNVGIGTSNPTESLSVIGDISLGNVDEKTILSSSNGNIGINITNPSSLLHVNGEVNIASNLIVKGIVYNYGLELFHTSNTGSNSTSDTTYLTSTVLDTFVESGNYIFDVLYGVRASQNNSICMGRVTLSNSLSASTFIHIASNLASDGADAWCVDKVLLSLPSGSNRFTLQYALNSGNGNATVTMKNTTLSLLRI